MRIKGAIFVLLLILGLVLGSAGCLGTKVLPVNRTAPPAVLVDYHRTGGTSGVDDRLVIFTNGVAIVSGGSESSEISLNQTDLALISVLFNESQFSELQANYPAPEPASDIMTYAVTYNGKTVTAQDTDIPPSLQTIIEDLNRFLRNTSAQKTAYPTLGINAYGQG